MLTGHEDRKGEQAAGFEHSLVEVWPEPMLLMDGSRFIDANPAALRLLGHADKSALLERSPDSISPSFQPDGEASGSKARKLLERALQGETLRFEWLHVRQDGSELHVDVTLSPLRYQGQQVVLCAWHDIGDLKRTQQALLAANLELRRFAHVAAHDLQAPLRAVASFAQLLGQKYAGRLDGEAEEWIGIMVQSAVHMQALIKDLLAYSRLEAQARPAEPTDLRQVFDEAVATLAAPIGAAGARVTCGDMPVVAVDRIQIAQVLQNLIENGIKYNRSATPAVSVDAWRAGDEWVVSVRDNGIGIPARYRQQVFDVFRRLHSQKDYPGTGIGLAICQRIVQHHGGRIWLESEEGQGSTFHFSLPANPAGAAVSGTPAAAQLPG